MNWHDKEIEKSSYIKPFAGCVMISIMIYFDYIFFCGVFTLPFWKDKLLTMVAALGLMLSIVNAIWILIDSRKIVNQIEFKDDLIEITNALKQKNRFKKSELEKIDLNQLKWFLGLSPQVFKTDDPHFSIYFNNSKSFIISPHMEEIETLKAELIKIIESNKK